jgi:tetratricopeptide (TPR) repeat protein
VRGRLSYSKLDLPPISPVITVTTLSSAADAVMLPAINARSWNPDQIDGPALLETMRTAARRFPDDPLALVALGRAEKRWGDPAAAETALIRALEIQDDHVEGLVLMADVATERGAAAQDEAERTRQWNMARDFLDRAMKADPTDHSVHKAEARYRRYAD